MKNNKYMSFPRNVVGNLPLSTSLTKEEKQPYLMKQVEDPRQKLSGMTPLFDNGYNVSGFIPSLVIPALAARANAEYSAGRKQGFTLIELLVVVLIIGILAAVALPQYQKVVERSKATQALTLLKAVAQAQTEYYLANGSYAQHFDDLSIDIPLTGNTKVIAAAQDTKSDGNWSLQLEDATAGGYNFNVYMIRTNGKYQGAGFQILLQSPNGINTNPQIRCLERKTGANITFDSSLPAGSYCEKIIHAPTLKADGVFERLYLL